MAYTFNDAQAPSTRKSQYFELVGNRAIYSEGWIACTTPFRKPWQTVGGSTDDPEHDFKWELYDMSNDFSQAHDLAAANPTKLKELQELFYKEAERNNVLPLDASFAERADPSIRPSLTRGRSTFTYREGSRIPEGSAPDFKNKSWSITADVEGGSNGVLCTMGGYFGGFSLLLKDGKPMFIYSMSNQPKHRTTITSAQKLAPGTHSISIDFVYDGGGMGKGAQLVLKVDGKEVAKGRIEASIPLRFSLDETWDVGEDTGTPLDFGIYDVPFKFNGELKQVTVRYTDGLPTAQK
jgi:arylsulfatase